MSKDLKSLIKTQVTISMKDGDKFRTTVLRMILAEIQKIEIDEKSDLNELQITSILEKMIKQRDKEETLKILNNLVKEWQNQSLLN